MVMMEPPLPKIPSNRPVTSPAMMTDKDIVLPPVRRRHLAVFMTLNRFIPADTPAYSSRSYRP